MDRQLLERMVGAGVLVLALVIITPAILDGNRSETRVSRTTPLPDNDQPLRTHTIRPDTPAERPPVAQDIAPVTSSQSASGEIRKTTPVSSSPVSAEKPTTKKKQAPKPKPKPVVTKPPEKSVAKPPPVKPGPEWAVQLGSFASKENAQGLVDKVGEKGFSAYLLPLARSGRKTLYRVRVGSGGERNKAEELASALEKAGYPGQVVSQ